MNAPLVLTVKAGVVIANETGEVIVPWEHLAGLTRRLEELGADRVADCLDRAVELSGGDR